MNGEYSDLNGDDRNAVVDPRSLFVSFCFVVCTLSASLFTFLLMERFAESSFLHFDDELETVNALAAVSVFLVLAFSSVAVIGVWIRNRRLLMLSNFLATLFCAMLILVVVWAASLQKGSYDVDIERGFNTSNHNVTCPTVPGSKCCGWKMHCNNITCPVRKEARLCYDYAHENLTDYVERVIPIVAVILIAHLLSVALGCTSRRWKLSAPPSALLNPSAEGETR